MLQRLLALLALLCACGAAAEAAPEPSPEAPHISLPIEFADAGGLAVSLWRRAGWAAPSPTIDSPEASIQVRIVAGLIHDCGVESAWACTERALLPGDQTYVFVSDQTPPEQLVSVLAHELGHVLGLEHSVKPEDIMNPDRSLEAREDPCVRWACL